MIKKFKQFNESQTVTLIMKDLKTGDQVVRDIDITNISNGNETVPLNSLQRKNLEEWIKDRGNDQHNTELELIDFKINR